MKYQGRRPLASNEGVRGSDPGRFKVYQGQRCFARARRPTETVPEGIRHHATGSYSDFRKGCGLVVHNKSIRSPESGAIGDARSVGSAQVAYSSSNGGYFGQLSCLGAPTSCGWPTGTTPFLDADITSLKPKQGYARSFLAGRAGKGKPDPGIETFVYAATPVRPGETGCRGFAIDHTGLICFTIDGTIPPVEKGALAPSCSPLK